MQRFISKIASDKSMNQRELFFYKNARAGFEDILRNLNKEKEITLLLPDYIGYSPNEGSGIYDPICNLKIKHKFYSLALDISVDLNSFKEALQNTDGKIVILLVHYFGYIDMNIEEIVKIAKMKNAIIIEDCAHAFFSDYFDYTCGCYSDVSFYSLHKMFPFKEGGMVRINKKRQELEDLSGSRICKNENPFEYDFKAISLKRKENAFYIEERLKGISEILLIRKREQYIDQTPQTFPILIKSLDKNNFYHYLNGHGFGVVSLYHTLIEPLMTEKINSTSKKILNLPVHQDIKKESLKKMCDQLEKLCRG